MGKYQDEDMSGLDITTVRDYATFMALSAAGQGTGAEAAIKRFEKTVVGGGAEDRPSDEVWMEFCGKADNRRSNVREPKIFKDSYELFDERHNVTSILVNGVMKKMMPSLGHGRIIRNRSSKNIRKDGNM